MKGRNGTVWHKHAPDFDRRGPEDIMRQQPGVTHQAQCNTIGQAFSLFITPEMIDLLFWKLTGKHSARLQTGIMTILKIKTTMDSTSQLR